MFSTSMRVLRKKRRAELIGVSLHIVLKWNIWFMKKGDAVDSNGEVIEDVNIFAGLVGIPYHILSYTPTKVASYVEEDALHTIILDKVNISSLLFLSDVF